MSALNLLPLAWRYKGISLAERAYLLGRLALCPFHRILPDLPERGDLLDFGCGSGLWLAYLAGKRPGLTLRGVDVDPRKIALARSCGLPGVRFDRLDPGHPLPEAAYDVVTCVDVLYLMPEQTHLRLLRDFHAALRPGGLLVLKETCDTPRFKYRLTRLQEHLAVKVLGFTAGDGVRIKSLGRQLDMLASCGYEALETRRIDSGYPHPSVVLSARKPQAATP